MSVEVCVVVSCYNQEKYIRECIESILHQKTSFDFEIYISDDASSDNTQEILRDFKARYPDVIRMNLRSVNLGAAANYIDAHNNVFGEIIFHFDGDDIMLPGKMQKQYDVFMNKLDVNLVFHRAKYFSDDGLYSAETGTPYFIAKETGGSIFDLSDLALWGTIAVHSSYTYRRNSRKIREVKREFMEWFFAMDSLNYDGKGYYLDEVLVKYRCNGNDNGNAYLASVSGRIKAYKIYFCDVSFYYSLLPECRKNLFNNYVFSTVAMLISVKKLPDNFIGFITSGLFFLSPKKILQCYRVRKSVSPSLRVR
jgi:glycosyltransferase involved in cell wall biosynthesis